MRVFGLTGNFGSGKSTVASMFLRAGIPVLDADRISREVTAPGGSAYPAVVREFGRRILLPDGSIDRGKLAEIVFADPGRRARLEAITHPAILEAMKAALEDLSRDGYRAAVVEAALIHESGRKGLFDAVIFVRCDEETQLRRVMARDGVSRERATLRLRAQMGAEAKAARSDHVIDNSGSPEETRAQVERLARILLA
ncbi:MAG: dephospho-coenzyme kinase [Deltaproteobacteria bacterium]|nr:dephospho-coenzyme kinase [Deltaproteobacteria bacterium]